MVKKDILIYTNTIQSNSLTKRGILSAVSQIYDPLGFLAPFVLTGKLLLQDICRQKRDWNDAINEELGMLWQQWLQQLDYLPELKVNRCIKPKMFGQPVKTEIHYFADASTKGYGVCAYMRIINIDDETHCSLVMAKAKVAPLKI